MGIIGLKEYDSSLTIVKDWLTDLKTELYLSNDDDAYAVLRAVFHSLRNIFVLEQAIQFGSKLPLLLAGTYYENWNLENKPAPVENEVDFYNLVLQQLVGREDYNPIFMTKCVFKVITNKLEEGNIDQLKKYIPEHLHGLLPEETRV